MHVHISGEGGEAKFWLEPLVSLACYSGLNIRILRKIQKIIEERKDEIERCWKEHRSRG
ncbi:MAG: DUF4160 domain-containing protein [Candidatus Ozemobacteraceae bacterium]